MVFISNKESIASDTSSQPYGGIAKGIDDLPGMNSVWFFSKSLKCFFIIDVKGLIFFFNHFSDNFC